MKLRDTFFTVASILAPNLTVRYLNAKYMARVYEGAQDYPSSDWTHSSGSSANAEIQAAQKVLISRSRDLARNNPYSKKAIDVIVSDTVGAGIVPNIKGKNKTQTKALKKLWAEIAETTLCDNERRHDFYGLQALALQTIVESGEILAIKSIDSEAPSLQLLEPDYIDSSLNSFSKTDGTGNRVISGIEVDTNNRRVSYQLFNSHPGDINSVSLNSKKVSAKDIIHTYNQTRAGQLRGVPWAHSVIEVLKDFADFQYATIIRQKIAACLVGAITTNGSDKGLLSVEKLKEKRQNETKMTPGQWRYLDQGESVSFSNPPNTTGYSEFTSETIRAVSCGYGITYESISNDYSKVNFSSGRMGHIQMRRNIERWRWNMLIPQFCEPYFKLFLDFATARGIAVDGVTVEWVPPAHVMIDPTKEVAAEKEAVKAGFKSKDQVIREQGMNPDMVREEIKAEREADAAAGLNFDVYEVAKPAKTDTQNNQSVPGEEGQDPEETDETDLDNDEKTGQ